MNQYRRRISQSKLWHQRISFRHSKRLSGIATKINVCWFNVVTISRFKRNYLEPFKMNACNHGHEQRVALIWFNVKWSFREFFCNVVFFRDNFLVAFFDCSLHDWFPICFFNSIHILQHCIFVNVVIFSKIQFFEKSFGDFLAVEMSVKSWSNHKDCNNSLTHSSIKSSSFWFLNWSATFFTIASLSKLGNLQQL